MAKFLIIGLTDAVGSTLFHPTLPNLLTCSGSRHFDAPPSPSSASSDEEDEEVVETSDKVDGSLKWWDIKTI